MELKSLTAAQIGAIYKKGGLGYGQAITRLVAMGYDQLDAELFMVDHGGNPPDGYPGQ